VIHSFFHVFVRLCAKFSLLFTLGVPTLGANILAGSEGVSDEDKMLLNCLEHVSYVKVFA
jgi:hypothetical protein